MQTSTTYDFHSALVGDQWLDRARFTIDPDGTIVKISSNESKPADHDCPLVALPGMVNVHSHAFQSAFAGLSEFRVAKRDHFWTWRDQMFEFLSTKEPDDIYQIAVEVYRSMLSGGYTWVGEFHYLHLTPDGQPYPNHRIMSEAVVQAARDAGIGISLLPVLYQRGGFRGEPLFGGQRRLVLSELQFARLMDDCRELLAFPSGKLGMAIHSLRAVDVAVARKVIETIKSSQGKIPIHIHVAEQLAEVNDCVQVHQSRSVQYLLDRLEVDENWCLIHATHIDLQELAGIVASGATVGLCPTTEANLGDGIFPSLAFFEAGGFVAIGSDSQVSTEFREELRQLEYAQRLQKLERAILVAGGRSVGRTLFQRCCEGGARALGIPAGRLQVGRRADMTLVDPKHPSISGSSHDRLLDRLVFCNHGNPITAVMVGGKWNSVPH